ncbi:helix-turn-helix domain-containing protein [Roseicella aquatilis]|uniref:XRE family transcriptional regulator n=1 Tax=Roseicella aquatilis TaxID=2527868 RepID=A0A4V2WM86_9PROT|nr:helix-turn-helix transcriptional regulator [Roseicella aquatilis]TCZ66610.1 XRE family transcriptional regulator [Roseicella aquatilis]
MTGTIEAAAGRSGAALPECDPAPAAAGAGAANAARQSRAPTAADIAVGMRIRSLRRAAGRTQKQLAQHIGVTNAQLHRYETGVSRVAASRLVAIARGLGVGVEVLLSDPSPVLPGEGQGAEELASLARAFAAISDPRHRTALLSLAHTMAEAAAAGEAAE